MNITGYFLIFLVLTGFFFAEDNLNSALFQICGIFLTALPIVLLLLVVLSAVIYAVGQVMGAETRARATVWATSMMTGAIIAALIFILVPYMLETLGIGAITDVKEECLSAVGSGSCSGITCLCGSGGSMCPSGKQCVNGNCVVISLQCNPPCKDGKVCVHGNCIKFS